MIKGDEGKPMTIFEMITDEPCEPEPYIDYLLTNRRADRAYWARLPNDRDPQKPTARDCVLSQIDLFIDNLESIKLKMHRPARKIVAEVERTTPVIHPCGQAWTDRGERFVCVLELNHRGACEHA